MNGPDQILPIKAQHTFQPSPTKSSTLDKTSKSTSSIAQNILTTLRDAKQAISGVGALVHATVQLSAKLYSDAFLAAKGFGEAILVPLIGRQQLHAPMPRQPEAEA